MAKRTITKLGFVRAPSYSPPPHSLLGIGDNACTPRGVYNPAERIDASRRAFTRHSSSSSSSSSPSPSPSHSPKGKYVPSSSSSSSSSSLISLSLLSAGSFEINSNCKNPSEARFAVVVVVLVVVVVVLSRFPRRPLLPPLLPSPNGGGRK